MELHWYALWVYRGLISPILSVCNHDGIQTYQPTHLTEHFTEEGKVYREAPLIANLLFVRTSAEYVKNLQITTHNRGVVYCLPGTGEPAAINDETMEMFMFVVSVGGRQLERVAFPIDKGDKVRVIAGIFKGTEGYIRRVHGTKRLVVAIEGVVAVAVTHIPRQFLELIEPAKPVIQQN